MVSWATLTNKSGFKASLQLMSPIVYVKGVTSLERSLSNDSVLRGTVILSVTRPLKVWDVRIGFEGYQAKVKGDNQKLQLEEVTFRGEECLWKLGSAQGFDPVVDCWESISSLREENNCEYLSPGSYSYPFQFVVPSDTPETLLTEYGGYSYKAVAQITYFEKSLKRHKTISQLVVIVRTLQENSLLVNQAIVSTGDWRGLLLYSVSVSNKCIKQNSSVGVSIKLDAIVPGGYNVFSVVISLHQTIRCSVHGMQDELGKEQGRNFYSNTTSVRLRNHYLSRNDFQPDGSVDLHWELPIKKIIVDNQTSTPQPLFPYTFHKAHDTIKITHVLKTAVVLQQVNEIDPESGAKLRPIDLNRGLVKECFPEYRSGKVPRQIVPYRSVTSMTPSASTLAVNQKVELTLSAPVVLLSSDSYDLVPPPYDDASYDTVSSSSSWFKSMRESEAMPPSYLV
ncbi:hypothetical protein BABINDRAFT_159350 [Babjeviella inositovora NRRL Y-12698]|uniref:Arrestin-like N-terminal domain-containing protein n=1 Tax=Babjeviella inositovora NRRL Y-12698 TaxID=984486 RepID=A0A1E3QYV7_9ASCO|nr:uncharacterized protein BABINDRAFT_159350 [Babjeviella inositovora NRRL Y-12698]ODQ82853.1 hypothetical protein BABINDRAFT_159350 [Babjeviella inositovora NRRL Y-12698]